MILNELNQLLKESVAKVATKNALTLDQKLLEQVEFEISAEQLRGDYASSCCLKLAKHFNKRRFCLLSKYFLKVQSFQLFKQNCYL